MDFFERINQGRDQQMVIPEMIADAEVKSEANPKTYEKVYQKDRTASCFAKSIDADLTPYEVSIWFIVV